MTKERAELHMHTQMFETDGIASFSAYIKRAAAWGCPQSVWRITAVYRLFRKLCVRRKNTKSVSTRRFQYILKSGD